MTPAAALGELHRAGVAVRLGPDGAVLLAAVQEPSAAVLALARKHRDGIRALLQADAGVPSEWGAGVAALATLPAPGGIEPGRWRKLARTSARLLHYHGAALHAAGWRTLDVFGLHRLAPVTHPPGWGLAWLLGARGEVLDVAADAVGMQREPGGARLVFRRRPLTAGTVPAWDLEDMVASRSHLAGRRPI